MAFNSNNLAENFRCRLSMHTGEIPTEVENKDGKLINLQLKIQNILFDRKCFGRFLIKLSNLHQTASKLILPALIRKVLNDMTNINDVQHPRPPQKAKKSLLKYTQNFNYRNNQLGKYFSKDLNDKILSSLEKCHRTCDTGSNLNHTHNIEMAVSGYINSLKHTVFGNRPPSLAQDQDMTPIKKTITDNIEKCPLSLDYTYTFL